MKKQYRLKYEDNWKNDIYRLADRKHTPITSLTKVRIDNLDYQVVSHKIIVPYEDMGKMYNSKSTHYFIKTKFLGAIREIDLNTVVPKTKVVAIDYTT